MLNVLEKSLSMKKRILQVNDNQVDLAHRQYVQQKLDEAIADATNPETLWLDSKDVFNSLRKEYRDV
jgi:hypothetical protein